MKTISKQISFVLLANLIAAIAIGLSLFFKSQGVTVLLGLLGGGASLFYYIKAIQLGFDADEPKKAESEDSDTDEFGAPKDLPHSQRLIHKDFVEYRKNGGTMSWEQFLSSNSNNSNK